MKNQNTCSEAPSFYPGQGSPQEALDQVELFWTLALSKASFSLQKIFSEKKQYLSPRGFGGKEEREKPRRGLFGLKDLLYNSLSVFFSNSMILESSADLHSHFELSHRLPFPFAAG